MSKIDDFRAQVKAGPAGEIARIRARATLPVGESCPWHHEYQVDYGPGDFVDSYCPQCREWAERLVPVVAQGWANDLVEVIPGLLDLIERAQEFAEEAAPKGPPYTTPDHTMSLPGMRTPIQQRAEQWLIEVRGESNVSEGKEGGRPS